MGNYFKIWTIVVHLILFLLIISIDKNTFLTSQDSHFEDIIKSIKIDGISCFISHAWGRTEFEKKHDDRFVAQLEHHLAIAGIITYYDGRLDSRGANGSIPRFMSNIAKVNYIIMIFTPAYKAKYEQGTDIATEVDYVITHILNRQPRKLIPILFSGTKETSIPVLLTSIKYYDFTNINFYQERFFEVLNYMRN